MKTRAPDERIDFTAGTALFFLIHLGCVAVLWTGASAIALALCAALYLARMFAITAGYHRYFSHRAFRTSRVFQFLLGWVGASSLQKGPLWWAGHHRHHHAFSDTELDIHSPKRRGLWWSHAGWILCRKYHETPWHAVGDLMRYRELVWLDRWHAVPGALLGAAVLALGLGLQILIPSLGVSSAQVFVWGFCVSTVFLYHGTFVINSLAHLVGWRRFATGDDSRNNFWLALITLGEGWHNNHHRYPAAERQGLFWWELDCTHLALKVLSWFGIVWALREPAPEVYAELDKPNNSCYTISGKSEASVVLKAFSKNC